MGDDAGRGESLRRAVVALAGALGARRLPPPPPRHQPLERVVVRLHALDAEMGRLCVCDTRTPAIYARLLAARLAYDGLLAEACLVLGLDEPGPPPLDGVARLEVEAGLTAAGLRW
ncbi:hypothetical protein [Angustibacter aerolatus]|uniref:DUF222 domain-containing protein n=1 Tax=Angustibacter aerolatus TaxID=1162965 RepID=A0ABQ6JK99_9ACTN|nr:hypothetical protein GCM10025868_35540 [Angustibacter aerolatus]